MVRSLGGFETFRGLLQWLGGGLRPRKWRLRARLRGPQRLRPLHQAHLSAAQSTVRDAQKKSGGSARFRGLFMDFLDDFG